jgi:MOSC domain-containing protein YiiM
MPVVIAVSRSARHSFTKLNELSIWLIEGSGVDGDAHAGITVRHRYAQKRSPRNLPPHLRQVHLMHVELFDELRAEGFEIWPGALGENITTQDIELLSLPEDTLLHIGKKAILKLTGLRTPCRQMDRFAAGLSKSVMAHKDSNKQKKSRAGVMALVIKGGEVKPGDEIEIKLPPETSRPLRHI